ncbi:MAG: hypothetical protein NT069_22215 [Planctomycetota bacterium]|nr:hypothetical protein [Planctomycetota bacterium]
MFTHSVLRRGLAGAAFAAFLALGVPAFAGQRYTEVDCDDDCQACATKPPLGYAICRHLKLQSVYTWRKVTRPYRRIATIPPELEQYAGPGAAPNAYTNPFGGSPLGGPGESFGSPYGYPPTGGTIRYNYGPSAASPGPAVIQYR